MSPLHVILSTMMQRSANENAAIQLHDVKISAKSNKGLENQTKLDFVIDTSLKCLSKHGKRPLLIATEKPMRRFRPKTSQKSYES